MTENYQDEQNSLPRRSHVLRNMALSFGFLTLLLFVVIGYTAFSRARIIITLGSVTKEVSFRLTLAEDIFGRERPDGSLPVLFLETTESSADTFVPTGEGVRAGKAGGIVTIHNETDRAQPLVATTRLLTSEGVLFRIKESVNVPARGTVTVAAEADKEGADGEIGPFRFTIPGLSPQLQTVIYATSDSAMVRGGASAKTVTEQDLETARQTLRQKLVDKSRQSFAAQVGEEKISPQDFVTEILEEKSSAKAGDAVSSFALEVRMKIVGVVFDKQEMLKMATRETVDQADRLEPDSARYTTSNFNPAERSAVLSGRATINSTIDRNGSVFSRDNFVGFTPDRVKSFLKDYEGIENVEVLISPYWQRHLPRIPSRISVEFKEG